MDSRTQNPFPGMNPYLEKTDLWREVHASLTYYLRSQLNAALPEQYVARVREYVWTPANHRRREIGRYIELFDTARQRVGAAIEFLSPSHKQPGFHRSTYLARRSELFVQGVDLLEIDLLRGGERFLEKDAIEREYEYVVSLRAAAHRGLVHVWPWTVRDRFPSIELPLRQEESVTIDLDWCLRQAFAKGQYAQAVDYAHPPVPPPFRPDDLHWMHQLLQRSRNHPT